MFAWLPLKQLAVQVTHGCGFVPFGQALGQAGLCFGVRLSRLRSFAVAADMRKIFYALAALGIGMASQAKGEGLIANGGFESGDGDSTTRP